MNRLKTPLRSTLSDERRSDLTLIIVQYEKDVSKGLDDDDEIIDEYAKT